ncbi:MAG: hypothetical protein KA369_22215 [Spirochaetes bacterium]|nr:hypothetical protein [Spirochaetota bacterium]
MKKMTGFSCLMIFCSFFAAALRADGAENRLYLHFFKSQVCPHCKQAEKELPPVLKRYPRITMVAYDVRNAMNQVDASNRQNLGKLIAMLQQIQARNGGKPFIYEGNTPHAFVLVNGVPYYMKKLSDVTTIKKEVPIPVFILGNRVYVGYQASVLNQAIAGFASGKN